MINIAVVVGRLTKDPEIRYMNTANGQTAKGRFSIAVNDGWGEKAQTLYFNIITWGKLAESCEKNLSKGKLVGISGKMVPGRYQNKEGQWVNTFDIVANNVEFLSPKQTQPAQEQPRPTEPIPAGFESVDGGIPF